MLLKPDVNYSPEQLALPSQSGKFTVFVLQKRLWNTADALIKIAKILGRGRKSVGYAGTKDRQSISVQLASIFGVEPDALMRVKLKDIKVNGAWLSTEGIKIGDLTGNNFRIRIEGASNTERIEDILGELGGLFPNYFDRQRFGLRSNNVNVGVYMLKGDFKSAVMEFLTSTDGEENEEAIAARKKLKEEQDFINALNYFPKYLKHERSMISYLARFKDNYANAIRTIPRGIALLLVHSVEGYIFNRTVEDFIRSGEYVSKLGCEPNSYGFPDISTTSEGKGKFPVGALIGYQTDDKYISDSEHRIMEELGIRKENFKIKGMPEMSMKGAYRTLLAPFKDFSYADNDTSISVSFSIQNGAYATILMNEFMKNMGFDLQVKV